MLDLDQPGARKILDACCLIEELQNSFAGIVEFEGEKRDDLFSKNRLKLGELGLLADELLPQDKRKLANHNIKLLYKVLTGQITSNKEDFEKIESLLNELSDDCFSCWCI
ncbi:hypothetical protein [Aliikangiella coralliicola]|uniref:Uncharacterized protein n=1 Tax=Aliikangiella coralliicola TaxID=2592383 RepID=A0A545UFN3_9GAMM|nr:hypothetical protein [Aliikangiella coralliicola]TQV88280.1 hypothetical protein FLL46_07060 [Aliikangiella coralliicola]